MILQADLPINARSLSDRRLALAMMTEIPNMREYADAWNKLAADFAALGYTANAEKCRQKADHYRALAGSMPEPKRQTPAAQERILFCANCETWTNHVLNVTQDFYSCGCGEGHEYSQSSGL